MIQSLVTLTLRARHACLIIIILSVHPALAQKTNLLDSLSTLLKKTPEGEIRLELYQKVFAYYTDISPDLVLAKKYTDSIATLAEKLKSEKWKYEAQFCYGVIAFQQAKNQEATRHLEDYIGYVKSQGDSTRIAKGLYYIAVLNINLGNFEKSLETFYRIYAIEEKTGNAKKQATILNSIGSVYKQMNKLTDAIRAYKHAAKTFQTADLKIDYAISLQNIGNIFIVQKSYDSARQCYNESLTIFREFKHLPFEATVLGNMGNLYEAQNDYATALNYHLQALTIWRHNIRKRSLANCLNNIGKSYLKLKKYRQSNVHLQEALTLAREVKNRPLLLDIYANLSALSIENKDFEKAYTFHLLSSQVKDSLYNEENTKQINELQAKYEAEKKDKQIAMLAHEKQVQEIETQRQATVNKALVGGLVFTIVIAALAYYIIRQRMMLTAKSNAVKVADFKHQLGELEMKALRAQINPHFLFNCMNAINLMIRKGETESACLYVSKFSKLVRLILENSEASSVTLENEIELLESYIALEELRSPGKIDHTLFVDDSIGIQNTYLPSMVLQPFVENAIWHGLIHKENMSKGNLSIDIRKEDDMLCCTIEDNGVGRDKAKQLRDNTLLHNKSMGIKITEDRLRLLSSTTKDQLITITDLIDSNNNPTGTRVKVYIPISE